MAKRVAFWSPLGYSVRNPNLLGGLLPLPPRTDLEPFYFLSAQGCPVRRNVGPPNAASLSPASWGSRPLRVWSVAFSSLIPYLGIREFLVSLMDHRSQELYTAR